MSRRTFIVLTTLVLILGSAGLYFILGGSAPVVNNIVDGLPFGEAPEDTIVGGANPDGTSSSETPVSDTEGETEVGTLSHFFKISDAPISGAVSINKNSATVVRYVDRATGHVYDVNPVSLERVRILNTTEPQIVEALWKLDGTGFVARKAEADSDIISNTSMTLVPPSSTSTSAYTVRATLLRGDIGYLAMGTDGGLVYSLNDSGTIAAAGFLGDRPRTLYQSGFSSWRIAPANAATVVIFTKASSEAPGFAYTLGLSGGSVTKILGPITALTALPSTDARRVVYSGIESNTNVFAAYQISNKTVTNLFPATLSEKCVWSKKSPSIVICGAPRSGLSGTSIDQWYKGLVRFSDQIWKFDTSSGTAELLLDPRTVNANIDMEKPILSPNEDYLFVTNKTDLSLWALKLTR